MGDLHEVVFRWPHTEPTSVIATGTFDQWSLSLHLVKDETGFRGVTTIPWGETIAYKFIVDGRWATHENQPTEADHFGNINNVYTAPSKPTPSVVAPPVNFTPEVVEPLPKGTEHVNGATNGIASEGIDGHVSEQDHAVISAPVHEDAEQTDAPALPIVEESVTNAAAESLNGGHEAPQVVDTKAFEPEPENPIAELDDPVATNDNPHNFASDLETRDITTEQDASPVVEELPTANPENPSSQAATGTPLQLASDLVDTVVAREGTSTPLGYVASGLGAAIGSAIGVDPINAEQIAIPTPKAEVEFEKLDSVNEQQESELISESNPIAPDVPMNITAVNAPENNILPAPVPVPAPVEPLAESSSIPSPASPLEVPTDIPATYSAADPAETPAIPVETPVPAGVTAPQEISTHIPLGASAPEPLAPTIPTASESSSVVETVPLEVKPETTASEEGVVPKEPEAGDEAPNNDHIATPAENVVTPAHSTSAPIEIVATTAPPTQSQTVDDSASAGPDTEQKVFTNGDVAQATSTEDAATPGTTNDPHTTLVTATADDDSQPTPVKPDAEEKAPTNGAVLLAPSVEGDVASTPVASAPGAIVTADTPASEAQPKTPTAAEPKPEEKVVTNGAIAPAAPTEKAAAPASSMPSTPAKNLPQPFPSSGSPGSSTANNSPSSKSGTTKSRKKRTSIFGKLANIFRHDKEKEKK